MGGDRANAVRGRRDYPGFDALRVLAACAVVFSHSFLIAEGTEANEPFQRLTGEIVGAYSVFLFFMLSGFLVAESASHASSVRDFASRRARRVYPAFLASALVIVALVCPWFAESGAMAFLTDPGIWKNTLATILFLRDTLYLPEVYFYETEGDADYLGHIANGVLWTIRAEVACYAFMGAMLMMRWLGTGTIILGTTICLSLNLFPALQATAFLGAIAFLAPSFLVGVMAHHLLRDRRVPGVLALASGGVLLLTAATVPGWLSLEIILFPLLFAAPMLWIGRCRSRMLVPFRRYGDPSYGIYLWAWPIQQVARALLGNEWSGYALAGVTLPPAILAGYASWHLIERPFLSARRHRRKRPLAGRAAVS